MRLRSSAVSDRGRKLRGTANAARLRACMALGAISALAACEPMTTIKLTCGRWASAHVDPRAPLHVGDPGYCAVQITGYHAPEFDTGGDLKYASWLVKLAPRTGDLEFNVDPAEAGADGALIFTPASASPLPGGAPGPVDEKNQAAIRTFVATQAGDIPMAIQIQAHGTTLDSLGTHVLAPTFASDGNAQTTIHVFAPGEGDEEDMGVADDMAVGVDGGAGADLSTAPGDLAVGPAVVDLSGPGAADLATARDLNPADLMSRPPDLAAVPDLSLPTCASLGGIAIHLQNLKIANWAGDCSPKPVTWTEGGAAISLGNQDISLVENGASLGMPCAQANCNSTALGDGLFLYNGQVAIGLDKLNCTVTEMEVDVVKALATDRLALAGGGAVVLARGAAVMQMAPQTIKLMSKTPASVALLQVCAEEIAEVRLR